MIFTDRTIIVQKGTSSINDTIILYRGDKEVEIRFTLNEGSPFRFGSGTSPNIIEKTEAAYGQLVIKTPNDLPSIFSEIEPTNEGKIVFTITAEMIDEITEVGNYTFQIRLFDESRNSRATLPEVVNGIEIREPIATEGVSTSNEVGVATVGYAMTTAGTTEDAFDSQGNYNKTTWETGDRITDEKLNKIEQGITGVNKKVPHYNETLMFEISGENYNYFANNSYFNMSALNIDEAKPYIGEEMTSDKKYSYEFIYDKEADALMDEINSVYIYNHKSYNGTNFIEDENSAVILAGGTEEVSDGYFKLHEIDELKLNAKCLPDNFNIKNNLTVGTRIGDIGEFSVTEGEGTTASGYGSHAEGSSTIASGDLSHAEGDSTTASGYGSHVEGNSTIASSDYQHVQGKYNIEDEIGTYAYIVGNGIGDTVRSNAHTLDWNGNGWYKGKLSQDGTPTEDKDLTTKKYVDDAIGNIEITGGSNINDTTASETTTYSSNKIENIKENLNSQIKDIENNMQNIGNPTDEQVKNAINEAIANGDIVAGGLTTTAQTLLVNILRNTLFTSDQSESITLLQSELAKSNNGGSSETTQYVISNNLSNATSSNNTVLVNANSSYVTTITANSGYVINSIIVTMGGTNITSSAVSGTTITISSVTGNVVITVTTTVSSSSGGSTELIQNGLVGLFDYRTAIVESPYNLIGWGNVAKATFDSCKEYFIFNNTGTYTVDATYGITTNWGIRGIRQTSSPATSLSINGLSNTVIGLVYGKCICNIYGMITTTNMSNEIQFTPKYINSSGSMVSLPSVKITANNYKGGPGYSLYALTESDTELKFYIDGKLMHTVNSSECTDFTKWYTNEECAYPYYNSNDAYTIAFAVYNRPLSATEIVEATEYFKAMEVNS